MRRSLLFVLSLMLVMPIEASAWSWRKSSASRYFYPSYYFNNQAYVANQTRAILDSARKGTPLSIVMQQAVNSGVPVQNVLSELIKAGIVTGTNLSAAVTAATQWSPASAGAVVQIAISNKMDPASAVYAAIAGSPRAAGPAVQAALTAQGTSSPDAARNILNTAYKAALGQTSEITAAARQAGISTDIITSAQPWNNNSTVSSAPTITPARSNASVSLISSPSAGGGGGGGSSTASPN